MCWRKSGENLRGLNEIIFHFIHTLNSQAIFIRMNAEMKYKAFCLQSLFLAVWKMQFFFLSHHFSHFLRKVRAATFSNAYKIKSVLIRLHLQFGGIRLLQFVLTKTLPSLAGKHCHPFCFIDP